MRSGALNVVAIEPKPESAPSVVIESAPASTSPSPLGGVAPPDQVMEAMVALTVVTSKSVKVSVPEGTVSTCVLPVVLMASVAMNTGIRPQHGRDNWQGGGLSSGTSINPGLTAVSCGGDKFRSRPVKARRSKIDRLELHRNIELLRARSARRPALLSQRKGRKRAMLGLLQFRHARRRIRNAGH